MRQLLVERVHAMLLALPRFQGPSRDLPVDGIYVFFEQGEVIQTDAGLNNRIVRVGTHRKDGRFRDRIRQHYSGNKNGSVFRKHMGGALLRRDDAADTRLAEWLGDERGFPEVEEAVTRTLRERFTFSCFPVKTEGERLALERGLIALLSQHPLAPPSLGWLGRQAAAEPIRRSGLWNTQHVGGEPLTIEEFALLERRVSAT